MKKFILGLVSGIVLASTIVLAASYVAEDASFKVFVNGKEFTSSKAVVIDGSTYLPLRAMGDVLGVPVNWNNELHQVEVGKETEVAINDKETKIGDDIKMTLLNCKSYNELSNGGFSTIKPDSGKEFVVATFEVENIGNEDTVFSLFCVESYLDDYQIRTSIISGDEIEDLIPLGANTIAPGKKIIGYLAYEVNIGWKKLEIRYNESVMDSKNEHEMRFSIKN